MSDSDRTGNTKRLGLRGADGRVARPSNPPPRPADEPLGLVCPPPDPSSEPSDFPGATVKLASEVVADDAPASPPTRELGPATEVEPPLTEPDGPGSEAAPATEMEVRSAAQPATATDPGSEAALPAEPEARSAAEPATATDPGSEAGVPTLADAGSEAGRGSDLTPAPPDAARSGAAPTVGDEAAPSANVTQDMPTVEAASAPEAAPAPFVPEAASDTPVPVTEVVPLVGAAPVTQPVPAKQPTAFADEPTTDPLPAPAPDPAAAASDPATAVPMTDTQRIGTPHAPHLRQEELEVPFEWFGMELRSRAEAAAAADPDAAAGRAERADPDAAVGGAEGAAGATERRSEAPREGSVRDVSAGDDREARASGAWRWALAAVVVLAVLLGVGLVAVTGTQGGRQGAARPAANDATRHSRDEQRQLPPKTSEPAQTSGSAAAVASAASSGPPAAPSVKPPPTTREVRPRPAALPPRRGRNSPPGGATTPMGPIIRPKGTRRGNDD